MWRKRSPSVNFPGSVGPIDFVGRNAAGHAHGALADVVKIFEEWLDGGDFHVRLLLRMAETDAAAEKSAATMGQIIVGRNSSGCQPQELAGAEGGECGSGVE